MAGYMTKLTNYIYEGELTNGMASAVENGVLLALGTGSANAGKLVAPTADTSSKLVCKEVTEIYGITAYRFIVNSLAASYYFVENGYEVNDSEEYDTTTYSTASGKLLRAHPLQVGDEFVTTRVTGTPVVGTAYGVKADGTIG